MQVDIAVGINRIASEIAPNLLQRAIYVNSRILRIVGNPYGNGRSPVTVAGNRPVAGICKPFAELSLFYVVGNPVNLLVKLGKPVFKFGYFDKPAGNGLVDKRGRAAPAVRITVDVAFS